VPFSLTAAFLRLENETFPRWPGNFRFALTPADALISSGITPASVDMNSRVALNEFNEVAYMGTDSNSQQALFATTLGATRKIIAVNDVLRFNNSLSTVTSLSLFNGLGKSGQIVFLAGMNNGDQLLVRANRFFSQAKLADSPIQPSYQLTKYLLKSVSNSGWDCVQGSIGGIGCNLTSTVNLLDYYGFHVSPSEYHDWLISKWTNAPGAKKRNYIVTESNDLAETAITEFTSERLGRLIKYVRIHDTRAGPNFEKLVSELRAGHAVKVRVPNGNPPLVECQNPNDPNKHCYRPKGHFVLAYGIVDPSTFGPLSLSDILIADPGHSSIRTLQDYGDRGYNQFKPTWFEDNQRLYLYTETEDLNQQTLNVNVGQDFRPCPIVRLAPDVNDVNVVRAVLTDPQGNRLGFDPDSGEFDEIPGGQYVEQEPYYSLDDDPSPTESVWGSDATVGRFWINHALTGTYSLEVIGVGSGSYQISMQGAYGLTTDTNLITGTITPGERRMIDFELTPEVTPTPTPTATATPTISAIPVQPLRPLQPPMLQLQRRPQQPQRLRQPLHPR